MTNGKNTLAVRLGRTATKWFYTVEVLAPYVLLPPLADLGWPAALPLLSLPLAGKLTHRFPQRNAWPGLQPDTRRHRRTATHFRPAAFTSFNDLTIF